MSDYSIVNAYFADPAQAERARDQLKSFGYGDNRLHIFDQQTDPQPEGKPKNSFLEGLTHMIGNREIGQTYTYGPRGERYVLRIEANEARAEEALRILEALSPFEGSPAPAASAPAAPAAAAPTITDVPPPATDGSAGVP